MEDKKILEEKIKYWIRERMFTFDIRRKAECEAVLNILSKEYKELTGEYYDATRK